MYHVYILENPKGLFYIGYTSDLNRRLGEHNSPEGHSHLGKFTHKNGPWQLVYHEDYPNRSSAVSREKEIKGWKSSTIIRRKLLKLSHPLQQSRRPQHLDALRGSPMA